MKNNTWRKAFSHALAGIAATIKTERNFRIHICFALAAVVGCLLFRVSPMEFALIAAAIALVLTLELVNTAIEAATDLACKGEQHPLAKKAKDAAAGAVLLASIFAVVVGVVVFLPRIIHLVSP